MIRRLRLAAHAAGGRAARLRTAGSARLERVPLRARLLAILLALLLAALAAVGWFAQSLLHRYLLGRIDDSLRSDSGRITTYAYTQLTNSTDPLNSGGNRVPGGYVVRIWSDGSTPTEFPSAAALGEDAPSFRDYTTTLPGEELFTVTSVGGTGSWRVYAATYIDRTRQITVSSQVAAPLSQVDRTVSQLRLLLLGLGLGMAVICALLGWLAIRRAFVPLRRVEDTAAAIAEGDLSRRMPEGPTNTEVGRLTASLNGMLTQIESAFRAREASEARTRRFAADASHELRTPLASVRGYAELYRQGAVPPEEVPRTMRRIEDEATRMGGLVEDLLLLARMDERRPTRTQPVDLLVLAADAVHDVHALDPTRRVSLIGLDARADGTFESPRPTATQGDEDRLRQVVANLLGNAVRHTPMGSPIEVAVGVTTTGPADQAVLEVRDHGPGLTTEQAERVFERFYRADPSRQRSNGTVGGGAGLGLSIVQAVVNAHGGAVEVRPTPGGGATFAVRLPAATDV